MRNEFRQVMDSILGRLSGVLVYLDDNFIAIRGLQNAIGTNFGKSCRYCIIIRMPLSNGARAPFMLRKSNGWDLNYQFKIPIM